jgi:hypothetical protein
MTKEPCAQDGCIRLVFIRMVKRQSTVQETTTTTTEVPEGVITTDVIQQYPSRFELLEKKGDKEIYLDHQTGRKIKVDKGKVERD